MPAQRKKISSIKPDSVDDAIASGKLKLLPDQRFRFRSAPNMRDVLPNATPDQLDLLIDQYNLNRRTDLGIDKHKGETGASDRRLAQENKAIALLADQDITRGLAREWNSRYGGVWTAGIEWETGATPPENEKTVKDFTDKHIAEKTGLKQEEIEKIIERLNDTQQGLALIGDEERKRFQPPPPLPHPRAPASPPPQIPDPSPLPEPEVIHPSAPPEKSTGLKQLKKIVGELYHRAEAHRLHEKASAEHAKIKKKEKGVKIPEFEVPKEDLPEGVKEIKTRFNSNMDALQLTVTFEREISEQDYEKLRKLFWDDILGEDMGISFREPQPSGDLTYHHVDILPRTKENPVLTLLQGSKQAIIQPKKGKYEAREGSLVVLNELIIIMKQRDST
ncbi:MAG: hypothetical protein ABH950_04215 [Candidatus Altiarchaeota archaeon]